jgi:DNA-binding NarL/FixJ family response regulator
MGSGGGGISVLVADDARDVRMMLRLSLERDGDITVIAQAADGEEAVRLAGDHQPDVVILDLSMPGGAGMETLAAVHSAAPGSKIIVVSGHDRTHASDLALAAGASAYIEKGGRTDLITDLVRKLAAGPAGGPLGGAPPPH